MATRKQICEAFKAAKKITALNHSGCTSGEWNGQGSTGRYEFICHALEKVALPGSKDAEQIVQQRFGAGGGTIYGWLLNCAKVGINNLCDDNVQAYKHRWLDSVIKEFSK